MRRPLAYEVVFAALVSLVVLAPGIWGYTLVDPWETHYGEVARTMRETHDYVHTDWPGTGTGKIGDNEGFRSKPALMFWMMSAGMWAAGVAGDGGYSGELCASARTMLALRLPFVLSAVAGLTILWWMLARLVHRRLAWLALLVVGSAPMYCLVARSAIPDMPLVACTIGAVSLFALAVEDGDRPITRFRRLDARHVVLGIAAAFAALQIAVAAVYFTHHEQRAFDRPIPDPALWLPLLIAALACAQARDGWTALRLPFILPGGIVAAILDEPMPARRRGQSAWRHVFDDVLAPWDRHALDRYALRGILFPFVWADGGAWRDTATAAARLLDLRPLTTMRQLYLLGCYFLLGISILAKGPPGLAVVALVGALHVLLYARWRALYEGAFELKRGLLMLLAVALPWHVAMFLRGGVAWKDEYLYTHILNRAASGVDNSPGTFAYYTSQIGHGMWLWAALLPAALTAAFLRSDRTTRAGRVRFLAVTWAIAATAVFCLVQTKFHHYILPAIPPLALLVAFLLEDLAAGRRLHPLFAALAAGIALLICRDLMHEPDRWIEMFTYRYDRPWPHAAPYEIDPSDGFLALGVAGAIALAALAVRRAALVALLAVGVTGLAVAVWALQIYMPLAGTHWGMGDAVRTYYRERTVYGQKLIYFDAADLRDDWIGRDRWTFETFIPDTLQLGQPIAIDLELREPDERTVAFAARLTGTTTAIGDHTITMSPSPGELDKLAPMMAPTERRRSRAPVRAVDADRLLAWQLYWRGENFWSGGEIWGHHATARDLLPEMKTSFVRVDNVELLRYLKDPQRAPLGRRYFVITEEGRIQNLRQLLPTVRARESFQLVDTTSNKFTIGSFTL
ncbi:MAG: hypothetical protein KF773_32615 [Deltaproteobacteria bacterium]|nr:hypothetical protein [Deltaproteobacteria bacterium]